MRSRNTALGLTVLALFALMTITKSTRAEAQTEKILHNFNDNGKDGLTPDSNLTFDKAGNLYGTTRVGGLYNAGTVFRLTPTTGGGWSERVLHSFNNNGKDGVNPYGGVILDSSGNVYGTTYFGGAYGYGTVFELIPQEGGGWPEKTLHSFNNTGTDGEYPFGSLIFDAVGNFYGTTVLAADEHVGAVFELKRTAGGGWAEKTVFTFSGDGTGVLPYAGLVFDAVGNLYGTTSSGGSQGGGTVFELSPAPSGNWTQSILYNFDDNGTDGYDPVAGLIFDSSGNLYGTTFEGGINGGGMVFQLSPASDGSWTETALYNFGGTGDGSIPSYGTLNFDTAGNLYGMTIAGGTYGEGTLFKLTPETGGDWTETMLHSFGRSEDGDGPFAGLIFDAAGNLYGTTQSGGKSTVGTVFEIAP